MPDISMCATEDCELKLACYRFTATPSDRQAYISPPKPGLGCEYFWANDESDYREYGTK